MTHGLEQIGRSNLWGLEDKLSSLLKPVTPDPVFVDSLKLKLSRTPSVILETSKRHGGLAVIGIGLIAGVLAYWLYRVLTRD